MLFATHARAQKRATRVVRHLRPPTATALAVAAAEVVVSAGVDAKAPAAPAAVAISAAAPTAAAAAAVAAAAQPAAATASTISTAAAAPAFAKADAPATDARIEELAQALRGAMDATRSAQLAQPPAAPLSVSDAYAVQRRVVALLTDRSPDRNGHVSSRQQFGWRVGTASAAAAEQPFPFAAALLTSQALPDRYHNAAREQKRAHSFDTAKAPELGGIGLQTVPDLQGLGLGNAYIPHGVTCEFGFWFRPFQPPAFPPNASQRERDAIDLAAARLHVESVAPVIAVTSTRWASGFPAPPPQQQPVDRAIMDLGTTDHVVVGEPYPNATAAAAERTGTHNGAAYRDPHPWTDGRNAMRRAHYGCDHMKALGYDAEFMTPNGFGPVMKALDDDYADWLNEQHTAAAAATATPPTVTLSGTSDGAGPAAAAAAATAAAGAAAASAATKQQRRRSHVALWCNDQRVASGDGTRALRGHPLLAVAWLNRWQWTQRANGIAFASLDAHANAHGGLQFVSAGACSGTAARPTKEVDRLWVADFGPHLGAVFLDDRPVSYW